LISKGFLREMLLSGILIFGGLWACACLIQKGLFDESRLGARRLEETAAILIEKAHRINDDLLMQETIQALAHAPGVAFACVVDRDGMVLAHSRPDQLGKALGLPALMGNSRRRPLIQDQKRWGSFIFSVSQSAARKSWFIQWLLQVGLGLILCFCYVIRIHLWEQHLQKAQEAGADYEAQLAEERNRHRLQEEIFQGSRSAMTNWVQSAVEHAAEGLILLDQRQRVVAANRLAALAVGLDDGASMIGKSWHEIPWLSACGKELERSLASPGNPVEWTSETGGLRLRFETEAGDRSGTWITIWGLTSCDV
jgi:PAS domain-containing protein